MQTFLPYPDFTLSARSLDRQRLGKQRVEALQLLKGSWPNHPASKMWRGYRRALAAYGIAVCEEWIRRGYKDTCKGKMEALAPPPPEEEPLVLPPWVGDPAFHRAHQSNLVRKKPDHYAPLFPDVPDDLEYLWPTGEKVA